MVTRRGYMAACAGVAAVTLFIGLVLTWVHISNISLLYLLAVLWLAAVYGRGAAIFASALSFLAYDFFFIPPVHLFTVRRPHRVALPVCAVGDVARAWPTHRRRAGARP